MKTVVLANGDFPRKGGAARRILDGAKRVVCCDGAADAFRRRTGREPSAVVGDCDSVKGRFARMVRVGEQTTNDLEKAVRWCRARGWRDIVVLGATGKREDHSLGNLSRAFSLGVEVVTDHGRFVPVSGRVALSVEKGAPVSVFAFAPGTKMTSDGLRWPLGGVRLDNLHCATLNVADKGRVVLSSNRRAYVFIASRRR